MNKKKITIEDLAIMVQRGFQDTMKKFEETAKDVAEVKEDVAEIKVELRKIDQRLVNIESDTSYLKSRVSEIGNLEIEHLKERVVVLEKKVGVA